MWKAFHYWHIHQHVMFIRDLWTKGNFANEGIIKMRELTIVGTSPPLHL